MTSTPDADKLPAADAFTIKVDTITITVQSMARGAETNDLVLNLPTPIGMDQVVTVSYTVPASTPNRGIQDTDGNKAASFTDESVSTTPRPKACCGRRRSRRIRPART